MIGWSVNRGGRTVIPLSVLDLAMVPEGHSSGQALAATTELARQADRLGFLRFWVAEHHNMETVASTSPAVLMAHLAANTKRIRVGSGGVMLPNHAPLAIAEQFALLESLYPQRVDLGIGRAPGTDRLTALALRGASGDRAAEDFPRHLVEVMGLLGDRRSEQGLWDRLRATPELEGSPTVVLLGSSGFSAQLAGLLGLPFAFAHHFDMGGTVEATDIYREHFEPSAVLDEPYTIVTASVIAAESDERAEWLSAPGRLRRYGLRTGTLLPLLTPDEALAHPAFANADLMRSSSILGTPQRVAEDLGELSRRTQASELMVHTSTHDLTDRLESFELVAGAWSLEPIAPAEQLS